MKTLSSRPFIGALIVVAGTLVIVLVCSLGHKSFPFLDWVMATVTFPGFLLVLPFYGGNIHDLETIPMVIANTIFIFGVSYFVIKFMRGSKSEW